MAAHASQDQLPNRTPTSSHMLCSKFALPRKNASRTVFASPPACREQHQPPDFACGPHRHADVRKLHLIGCHRLFSSRTVQLAATDAVAWPCTPSVRRHAAAGCERDFWKHWSTTLRSCGAAFCLDVHRRGLTCAAKDFLVFCLQTPSRQRHAAMLTCLTCCGASRIGASDRAHIDRASLAQQLVTKMLPSHLLFTSGARTHLTALSCRF